MFRCPCFFKSLFFQSFFILPLAVGLLSTINAHASLRDTLRNLNVQGTLQASDLRQLSVDEFMRLEVPRTASESPLGKWYGLVTHLHTESPVLHVIDTQYYDVESNFPFSARYGTHERYARANGLVENSEDFIQQVQALGNRKEILPIIFYLPYGQAPTHNGQLINWVFQNRRYVYSDSSEDFTQMLVSAQKATAQALFSGEVPPQAAFINYSKARSHRRPNDLTVRGQEDIHFLENEYGYNVLSERELLELTAQSIEELQILNLGPQSENNENLYESYGILKLIEDQREDCEGVNCINDLSLQDIALFEELPERIFPVSGIIVLERQTELSHVNLLAKNRGTFNISLESTQTNVATNSPEFIAQKISGYRETLIGQPVRIQIHPDTQQISIELSTRQAVRDFVEARKAERPQLAVPEIEIVDENRWLLNPSAEALEIRHVGAKAANYGKMENWLNEMNIVEAGRAIGFNLYKKVIQIPTEYGTPAVLIGELLTQYSEWSQGEITQKLEAIQEAIEAIEFDQIPRSESTGRTVVDEIKTLLNTEEFLDVGRIRLRSSTNAEDLPNFNGAGLYNSEGFTAMEEAEDGRNRREVDEEKLWKKLKEVLASLWYPRAFFERDYFGIDHSQVAMAVQINPAFSDKWLNGIRKYEWANGVVLYSKQNNVEKVRVNSQFGEASVTNPLPGEIPESFVYSNETLELRSRSNVEGQIHEIFIQSNEEAFVENRESKNILKQLLAGVRKLHEEQILNAQRPEIRDPHQYGIDIEFKIMMDENTGRRKAIIKQSRLLRLSAP